MLQLLLFLHVLGAIIAFGPTFAFPIIGPPWAQRSRSTATSRPSSVEPIERRIVIPGAILQGITGVGLILVSGADLTSQAYRWLVAAIVLYLIAILYRDLRPAAGDEKLVELTASRRPPAPRGAAGRQPPEITRPPGAPARRDAPRGADRADRDPDGGQAGF